MPQQKPQQLKTKPFVPKPRIVLRVPSPPVVKPDATPQTRIKLIAKPSAAAPAQASAQKERTRKLPHHSVIEEMMRQYLPLEYVYDGVFITTVDGMVLAGNARACERFLCDRPRMYGKPIDRFLAGLSREMLKDLVKGLQQKRFALVECYALRRDGTAFPAEVSVNLVPEPEKRLCFFVRDVSWRKEREDFYRMVSLATKNAPVGIASLSMDGVISYANKAFATILGLQAAEGTVVGRSFARLFKESDEVTSLLRDTVDTRSAKVGEFSTGDQTSQPKPIRIISNINLDAEGYPIGLIVSVEDLTEARRAEQLLRDNAHKEAMLASLCAACHHLAQPVTAINGILELLRDEIPASSPLHARLIEAIEEAQRITEVLHRLSRVETFQAQPYLAGSDHDQSRNLMLEI